MIKHHCLTLNNINSLWDYSQIYNQQSEANCKMYSGQYSLLCYYLSKAIEDFQLHQSRPDAIATNDCSSCPNKSNSYNF